MTLCCALTAVCLAFIWGNSLLPGEISGAISDQVEHVLEMLLPEGEVLPEESVFPLRKLAHFTEFTALGLCLTFWNAPKRTASGGCVGRGGCLRGRVHSAVCPRPGAWAAGCGHRHLRRTHGNDFAFNWI